MALVLIAAATAPGQPRPVRGLTKAVPETVGLLSSRLTLIDEAVRAAIEAKEVPGAVILVARHGRIAYLKAFGNRALLPEAEPMTVDTIFDAASLTKVVATTTAVMQLVEEGSIDLDRPAKTYWPAFGRNGKSRITNRHLLTHYSGLRADLDMKPRWSGYEAAMTKIINEKPVSEPGAEYLYSDINFEALGEIIRRVTGEELDRYCATHIFRPLGMNDTGFKPAS